MFGSPKVDESTRHRFDISTADNVNMSKYELGRLVEKTRALGDTHFTKTDTGSRKGNTVVTRVVGTAPTRAAKNLLEQMLGNTSVV